tara:strand:+ start:256 stop:522 length:267 start_codon:yes stop_codon:yes gene_type:complete
MGAETSFHTELANMVSKEVTASMRDPEAMAGIMEALCAALGRSIAVMVQGDPAAIDKMVSGCEAYIMSNAVEMAPTAQWIASKAAPRG